MDDQRPMIVGGHVFRRSGSFYGMVGGRATIPDGVHIDFCSMVARDLIVENGGSVELTGTVAHDLIVESGGAVELKGMIGGRFIDKREVR